MITLGIETSCDETSVALLETSTTTYRVLAHTIFSQIDIHAEYGGVFPMLAKREHARRLVPMLVHTINESKIATEKFITTNDVITPILEQNEKELLSAFLDSTLVSEKPVIDRIAVTYGPGLEPALWVGVNFARALSALWNVPIIPVNHMEGHIVASLMPDAQLSSAFQSLRPYELPAIALLISGGHTELVYIEDTDKRYTILGRTRDDAVGEAYDKVARMVNLPYPGGPMIAELAEKARGRLRIEKGQNPFTLPRPMIHSKDLDFSFSGLKTSVLYLIRELKKGADNIVLDATTVENIALAFEDAVTEVLAMKTAAALDGREACALIVGGGVVANRHIQQALIAVAESRSIPILFPPGGISGDNALMIALAGALQKEPILTSADSPRPALRADGNLSL